MLQAEDLLNVLDLDVGADLRRVGLADVEQLSPADARHTARGSEHHSKATMVCRPCTHTHTLTESPHMLQSTPEWEDPVVVSPNDAEPADSQRLGTIALGEDERAQVAVAGAGLVGVIELGNACDLWKGGGAEGIVWRGVEMGGGREDCVEGCGNGPGLHGRG